MRTIAPNARPSAPSSRRASSLLRRLSVVSFIPPGLLLLGSTCVAPRGTIGAVIAQQSDSGRVFLREVPPGLAAAKAALKPGDEILLIDGRDVRSLDPKQIHGALVGEVGAPVKLTLLRDEQVLRVTLQRTEGQKLPGKKGQSSRSEP